MYEKNKISVVMVNKNHSRYLNDRFKSIVNQTFAPKEIFIIDDYSTDESHEIYEDLKKNFYNLKIIKNSKSYGPVVATNIGLQFVKTEYVHTCSVDDIMKENFFKNCTDVLDQYPKIGLCLSRPGYFNKDNYDYHTTNEFDHLKFKNYFSNDEIFKLQKKKNFLISGHSLIYRMAFLKKNNFFDKNLKWHCDWYINNLAAATDGICFAPQVQSYYRLTPLAYSHKPKGINQQIVLNHLVSKISKLKESEINYFFYSGIFSSFGPELYKAMLLNSKNIKRKVLFFFILEFCDKINTIFTMVYNKIVKK